MASKTVYTVVKSTGKDDLINQVNALLEQGYELQGGVSFSITLGTGGLVYYAELWQALTKTTE